MRTERQGRLEEQRRGGRGGERNSPAVADDVGRTLTRRPRGKDDTSVRAAAGSGEGSGCGGAHLGVWAMLLQQGPSPAVRRGQSNTAAFSPPQKHQPPVSTAAHTQSLHRWRSV